MATYRLEPTTIQCPHCWEEIEILIDLSVDDQIYTEDCSVCCRPILLEVAVTGDDDFSVVVRAEE